VRDHFRLDAIVTMVDAVHAPQQLEEHHEAQEQVGFADRLLVTKTDLAEESEVEDLRARLRRMNPRAKIAEARHGVAAVDDLLDIHGFDLSAILEIEPAFLTDLEHEHDDDVTSFVFRERRPLDLHRVESLLGRMLRDHGPKLMRYKGVLSVKGVDDRVVFQGVHMVMGSTRGARWKPGEARESKMVFIGRDMPRELLLEGLAECIAARRATSAIPPPGRQRR
jgi:G3E family GTPase